MDWLNLHTSILDSENVVGSDPVDRGSWLMLLRYCIGQENGGLIADCAAWKDRKWQQLARVTLAEVKRESDLWQWAGVDLVVWGYPLDKETQVKAKREIAKTNGGRGGRPKTNPAETHVGSDVGSKKQPSLVIFGKAEEEGEGKEKEKEWNNPCVSEVDVPGIVSLYPRRERYAESVQIVSGHLAKGESAEAIEAGTRAFAAVIMQLPGGAMNRFVPSAANFFRERRWEDDPQTMLRLAGSSDGAPATKLDLGGRKGTTIHIQS